MNRNYAVAALLALGGALTSRGAGAADKYLCCDLTAQDGACVAQASSCAGASAYSVALSDLMSSDVPGAALMPGYTGASFPSGVDGYASWTQSGPWVGFCLDAPSTGDPMHAGPTEPSDCMTLSLNPGISGELADVDFPVDPRWDAYQLCYGAPNGPVDSGVACQNPNDANDPSVTLTPAGSCCGPAHLLGASNIGIPGEWQVSVAQEIPGVPPPVLVYGPDGGLAVVYNPDAGYVAGSVPATCLAAYNEPTTCGQPPPADGGLAASGGSSATGGAGDGSTSAAGTCSVSGVGSGCAGRGALAGAGCMLGLALARTRRRRFSCGRTKRGRRHSARGHG